MITYSAQILGALGKKGRAKKDKNGYYDIMIGVLGAPNVNGITYLYDQAKHLFESNSVLQRRIASGGIYGEHGHPYRENGMKLTDYIRRLAHIEPKNKSTHFKMITLDDQIYQRPDNSLKKGQVGIVSKLKPAGRFGPEIEASLNNPDENTAWSIRSLTDPVWEGNKLVAKIATKIFTFDSVNSGGFPDASKWHSVGCEDDLTITKDELNELKGYLEPEFGLEDDDKLMLRDIIGGLEEDMVDDKIIHVSKTAWSDWG